MRTPRIQIVEDEAIVATEMESTLRNLGYNVTSVANSGEQAIRNAGLDTPDIVLMDIRIQGDMDGIETADIIRSRFGIPIVFTTAHMDEERIERAKLTMPFGYLLKPIQEKDLRVTLEMALHIAKTEAERRSVEERFKIFFRAIDDAIFVHPKLEEGFAPFIEVNDHACQRYGYTREEFLKLTAYDITKANDVATHGQRGFRKKLGNDGHLIFETYHIKKNGAVFPVEINSNIIEYLGKPAILAVVRDISERKQAEKALQDSERKYRSVVENANEAILILQDGTIQFFNQKTCDLTGYTKAEIDSRNYIEFVHPKDQEIVTEYFINRQDEFTADDPYTLRIIGKNGKTLWVEVKPVIINWNDDKAILCFISDITEKKEAAEKIKASEQTFRSIVESSPMGIHLYQLKPDNRLILTGANPAADKILKIDNSQHIGKTIEEAFPALASTEVPDRYRKAASKGIPWHTEQAEYEDARIKGAFDVHAFQMTPGNMAAVFFDITERKQAEIALKNSESRFRQLADNIKEVFWISSVDWQTIHYVSPAFREIWQRNEAELYQDPHLWIESIFSEDRKTVIAYMKQLSLDKPHEMRVPEFRITRPDGDERWIQARGFPVYGKDGKVYRIAGIAEDITEKKKTWEMMVQTEKMTSIGNIAAGMAHELNNPLGAMLQGIQIIQRRLSEDLTANIRDAEEAGIDLKKLQLYMTQRGITSFIEGIQESGKRASDIVVNMLKFSRRSESKLAPANIVDLVENVLELARKDYNLKKKYDFRNIEIVKAYDPDLPLIPMTETEVEQVLINLLHNAAWAMFDHHNGTAPRITIGIFLEKEAVRIEIEDNGPGMDDSTKKRIFEPFYTTKPVGEGTGLGLSVSYMIITHSHMGTMAVDSKPGKGTRFIIRLPLDREKPL